MALHPSSTTRICDVNSSICWTWLMYALTQPAHGVSAIFKHSYMRRDSSICWTWLMYRVCTHTASKWSFSHSYLRHDSSICWTWLMYELTQPANGVSAIISAAVSAIAPPWVMSHTWMSHGAHMSGSGRVYVSYVICDWMSHVTHVEESWCTYEWVLAPIWMSQVTCMNELHRVAKTHRMPYLYRSFSAESPYN